MIDELFAVPIVEDPSLLQESAKLRRGQRTRSDKHPYEIIVEDCALIVLYVYMVAGVYHIAPPTERCLRPEVGQSLLQLLRSSGRWSWARARAIQQRRIADIAAADKRF